MADSADIKRARNLARATMELCDRIGNPLAANYVSMALDQLDMPDQMQRIAEPRPRWGELE